MELYPHNQRAYENAVAMLKIQNHACIIHPTGTGKAIIISRFIEDNPNADHLVLAPGMHIFTEIKKHCSVGIICRTYSSINSKDDVEQLTGFTFIYLDEFHRTGAEVWGSWAMEVIFANPNAKLVGTTATHIRFLDQQRDMAAEIFKGSIASYISLNRAFALGILWPPKYVNALYSVDEEYDDLTKKIEASDHKEKKSLVSELTRRVVDWQRTSGIDAILKKHIPPSRKKIIIFCKNIEGIETSELLLMPIFRQIFKDVVALRIHSKMLESKNSDTLQEFRDVSLSTKVLFTVDMMNEGLHGKDISVGILMRSTTSPIVFYQQIGRCFSIGQTEQPIIIDLVNNFKNVHIRTFQDDFETEIKDCKESKEIFDDYAATGMFVMPGDVMDGLNDRKQNAENIIQFVDETQEIQEVFKAFGDRVEDWEVLFLKAEAFYKEFGHLAVPKKFNRSLLRWLQNQRYAFKEGSLSPYQIERLSALRIDWNNTFEDAWNEKYLKYKALVDENNGSEPTIYKDAELRDWVKWQRRAFSEGTLSDARLAMLSPIMSFENSRTIMWKRRLDALRGHLETGGNFNTPSHPIYKEVLSIRSAHRNKTIPDDVFLELTDLSFRFQAYNSWDQNYDLLIAFKASNGRLPTIDEDKKLYSWMHTQRYRFNKGKLSQEYIPRLVKSGIISQDELDGGFVASNSISDQELKIAVN